MSLRPTKVNYDVTWQKIKGTLKKVIMLDKVSREDWNERFSYPFQTNHKQRDEETTLLQDINES